MSSVACSWHTTSGLWTWLGQTLQVVASLKDTRDRIQSVKNTQKITEAMKLVAAAKVRRAQDAVINGRPFAENLVKVSPNKEYWTSRDFKRFWCKSPSKLFRWNFQSVRIDSNACCQTVFVEWNRFFLGADSVWHQPKAESWGCWLTPGGCEACQEGFVGCHYRRQRPLRWLQQFHHQEGTQSCFSIAHSFRLALAFSLCILCHRLRYVRHKRYNSICILSLHPEDFHRCLKWTHKAWQNIVVIFSADFQKQRSWLGCWHCPHRLSLSGVCHVQTEQRARELKKLNVEARILTVGKKGTIYFKRRANIYSLAGQSSRPEISKLTWIPWDASLAFSIYLVCI